MPMVVVFKESATFAGVFVGSADNAVNGSQVSKARWAFDNVQKQAEVVAFSIVWMNCVDAAEAVGLSNVIMTGNRVSA